MKEDVKTQLSSWFKSGKAYALMRAYQEHHADGTTGIMQGIRTEAVMDERGVLRPERFEQYMHSLRGKLMYEENAQEHGAKTLRLLESTLIQMIGSVNFGDRVEMESNVPLKDLFEEGKQMGTALGAYCDSVGLPPLEQQEQRRRVR